MDKSALELFEELGYHVNYRSKITLVYTQTVKDTHVHEVITFNAVQKKVYAGYREVGVCKGVDMPLLKAINKQCEELGWLDE